MSRSSDRDDATLDRRDFLRLGAAAGAGLLTGTLATGSVAAPAPAPPTAGVPMPTRNLGRTGHRVPIFSLGGQSALERPDNQELAVAIVERALDLGVNYIDTAAMYGGSERWSQRYIGQVMRRRRDQVFLASKTHDRTRDGSLRLLEESLRLLQTDRLDLWQVHNLSRMEQVDQIFAPGGAMEALRQARDQKLVRHLGISGHADPAVLIAALRRFPFDTILLALNAADPHHLSFSAELLPLAVEQRLGIIGMKVPGRGRLLATWTPPPESEQRQAERPARPGLLSMREAFDYVLSLPVSTVIIGCDTVAQLEENVALARTFTPVSQAQMAALTERSAPVARQALFFRRWS